MIWSPNLAYAIGLITSDGCLSKDGRHIDFTSKDLEQIQNFINILGLKNKIALKSSGSSDKKYYRVQFGNVKFYNFLLSIGLTPSKSKRIIEVKIPQKYFIDFLRGCLDGDGCTYSYWDSRWKSSFMLYTEFASGSVRYLEWMKDFIEKNYNINGKIYVNIKRGKRIYKNYQLKFAKYDSIKLLNLIYYSTKLVCLSRKRFKIELALSIISKHAGVEKSEASLA